MRQQDPAQHGRPPDDPTTTTEQPSAIGRRPSTQIVNPRAPGANADLDGYLDHLFRPLDLLLAQAEGASEHDLIIAAQTALAMEQGRLQVAAETLLAEAARLRTLAGHDAAVLAAVAAMTAQPRRHDDAEEGGRP